MSRILIVEDHADMRRLIRMTLDFAGHQGEIEEAADSQDGLAPCQGVKGDPLTCGAAVVMLTARGSAVDRLTRGNAIDRVAAADAGASACLGKPFSPLELIRTLEGLGVAA